MPVDYSGPVSLLRERKAMITLSLVSANETMDIAEFRRIDGRLRVERPKPFLLAPPDPPASVDAIREVERRMGVALPESYGKFLSAFGGGNFGLTNVYSAERDGEFYLPTRHRAFAMYAPSGLLAFSDDFAGGNYVLRVSDGIAEEEVYYWHVEGGLESTPFANVLEFIARYAYHPA